MHISVNEIKFLAFSQLRKYHTRNFNFHLLKILKKFFFVSFSKYLELIWCNEKYCLFVKNCLNVSKNNTVSKISIKVRFISVFQVWNYRYGMKSIAHPAILFQRNQTLLFKHFEISKFYTAKDYLRTLNFCVDF